MPGRAGPGHLDEAGIRARLRIATAAQHERLDCALAYVIDAALTRDRYVDLLDAMLGFYAPFEQQLASWDASGALGLPVIHRARLLALDLQALGRDPAPLPCARPCRCFRASTMRPVRCTSSRARVWVDR